MKHVYEVISREYSSTTDTYEYNGRESIHVKSHDSRESALSEIERSVSRLEFIYGDRAEVMNILDKKNRKMFVIYEQECDTIVFVDVFIQRKTLF